MYSLVYSMNHSLEKLWLLVNGWGYRNPNTARPRKELHNCINIHISYKGNGGGGGTSHGCAVAHHFGSCKNIKMKAGFKYKN